MPKPTYDELVERFKELTHEADYQIHENFPSIGRLSQEVRLSLEMLAKIDPSINS